MSRLRRRAATWFLLPGIVAGLGFAVARAAPPPDALHYVRFAPLFVPIYADGRAEGLLAVRISIRAADEGARARLERLRPRLVDAYMGALVDHARLRVDPARPIDMDRLSATLQRVTVQASREQGAQLLVLEAVAKRI